MSYVLNDAPQSIPAATRRKVLDAAAALGYRPSPTARSLRTGRSHVVLGLMPEVPGGSAVHRAFAELGSALKEYGLSLVVHPGPPDPDSLDQLWRAITPACVFSFVELPDETVVAMQAGGTKVAVTFTASPADRPWHFHHGDQSIGQLQAEHLIGLGHTDIAIAVPADPRHRTLSTGRLTAVTAATAAAGYPAPARLALPPGLTEARDALRLLLEDHPAVSAVAAWNDGIGNAVLAAARLLDVDVPDRLAVIGAYDEPGGAFSTPALTTVRVDLRTRMRSMAQAVVSAVEGHELALPPLDMTTLEIVRRQST